MPVPDFAYLDSLCQYRTWHSSIAYASTGHGTGKLPPRPRPRPPPPGSSIADVSTGHRVANAWRGTSA
eukprot:2867263-Rhodomonas_salina.1